jgi:hypothetical protein
MGEKNSIPQTSLMKKIRLNSLERLIITHLFPEQGNKFQMMIADELSKKIAHSKEEMDTIGMVGQRNQFGQITGYRWKDGMNAPLTLPLNEVESTFLRDRADLADRESRITRDLLPICKKIWGLGTSVAEEDSDAAPAVQSELEPEATEIAPGTAFPGETVIGPSDHD